MIGFGSKVKNPGGDSGVVTWVGKQFPDGWKVKVKWDVGGSNLVNVNELVVT